MNYSVINKEIDTYLALLSSRQKSLVLDMIKSFLHIDPKEKRISIEQYNKELDEAITQVKNGKTVSYEEVLKRNKKWLKRK